MPTTVEAALNTAMNAISKTGSVTAALDASVLIEHVTGKSRVEILTYNDAELTGEEETKFSELVERRIGGEPIAYILGEREFWGLPFKVKPGILIPRPDTETILGTLCALIGDKNIEGTVADIGVGSGAIIVSMLHEFPNLKGIAVDVSDEAIAITKENAEANGVIDRLDVRKGEYCAPLEGEHVDILISNPPYIRESDMEGLQKDVKDFEPHLALVGGTDGLVAYKQIIPQAEGVLEEGGLLMLEIGFDQKADIVPMLENDKWQNVQCFKDLGGNDRVVMAIKK